VNLKKQLNTAMLSVKGEADFDVVRNTPRLGRKQRKAAPPETGKEPL